MTDAQNERTKGRNRRRRQRHQEPAGSPAPAVNRPSVAAAPEAESASPVVKVEKFVRPPDIAPPTVRSEEYCVHHMASHIEHGPMEIRTGMTKLRHLQVDHFGEATLYCDCLHHGPHEWPLSMQVLQTAIELDQFIAASTRDE